MHELLALPLAEGQCCKVCCLGAAMRFWAQSGRACSVVDSAGAPAPALMLVCTAGGASAEPAACRSAPAESAARRLDTMTAGRRPTQRPASSCSPNVFRVSSVGLKRLQCGRAKGRHALIYTHNGQQLHSTDMFGVSSVGLKRLQCGKVKLRGALAYTHNGQQLQLSIKHAQGQQRRSEALAALRSKWRHVNKQSGGMYRSNLFSSLMQGVIQSQRSLRFPDFCGGVAVQSQRDNITHAAS
eukprot:1150479-Pelagomonas_calceolata.AAC.1